METQFHSTKREERYFERLRIYSVCRISCLFKIFDPVSKAIQHENNVLKKACISQRYQNSFDSGRVEFINYFQKLLPKNKGALF